MITLGSRQISRKIQNELEQWRHHYKFPSAEVIKIGQKRAQTLRCNDFLAFSERLPLFHALKPWESLHNSSPGMCRRFNSTCWGLPVREHNCLALNARASHSTYAMQSTSTYLRPKAECGFLTSLNISRWKIESENALKYMAHSFKWKTWLIFAIHTLIKCVYFNYEHSKRGQRLSSYLPHEMPRLTDD